MGVNGGASGFNFFDAVSGVAATPVAEEGVDTADGSSIALRFAIATRCLASLAAFCFSSNSAFVFAMIASNSFLRFCASVTFCGVVVFAAAFGLVVGVVGVVVAVFFAAGVDASGVFAVAGVPVGAAAAAAAAEPKGVDGVPNGADGFPNGAAADLLPLPNAGVEVAPAPNPVDGFAPNIPPVVGVEAAVGDVPDGLVANELKTEPKAGFAAKGAAEEPNGDSFEAVDALPNGDDMVVVGAAEAAARVAAGFFSSSFFAVCSLIGEGAMVTVFGFSIVSFGFSAVVFTV